MTTIRNPWNIPLKFSYFELIRNIFMGIVKIVHISLQWRKWKSTFCLRAKWLLPLEAVPGRFSMILFVKILRNYEIKTYTGVSFLIKFQVGGLQPYLKRLRHRYFAVNFAKFKKTPFPQKNKLKADFVFSSRSVPLPKRLTNGCGM